MKKILVYAENTTLAGRRAYEVERDFEDYESLTDDVFAVDVADLQFWRDASKFRRGSDALFAARVAKTIEEALEN